MPRRSYFLDTLAEQEAKEKERYTREKWAWQPMSTPETSHH